MTCQSWARTTSGPARSLRLWAKNPCGIAQNILSLVDITVNFARHLRSRFPRPDETRPARSRAKQTTLADFNVNSSTHKMEASKTPVKLVKVTRVLGRTGTTNPTSGRGAPGSLPGAFEMENEMADDLQARVVVLPRCAWSSWTTRPVRSSATSRARVGLHPTAKHDIVWPVDQKANLDGAKFARTTSCAFSNPNVRPDACDKRGGADGDGGEEVEEKVSGPWRCTGSGFALWSFRRCEDGRVCGCASHRMLVGEYQGSFSSWGLIYVV